MSAAGRGGVGSAEAIVRGDCELFLVDAGNQFLLQEQCAPLTAEPAL